MSYWLTDWPTQFHRGVLVILSGRRQKYERVELSLVSEGRPSRSGRASTGSIRLLGRSRLILLFLQSSTCPPFRQTFCVHYSTVLVRISPFLRISENETLHRLIGLKIILVGSQRSGSLTLLRHWLHLIMELLRHVEFLNAPNNLHSSVRPSAT